MHDVSVGGERHLLGVQGAGADVTKDHSEGPEGEHRPRAMGDDVLLTLKALGPLCRTSPALHRARREWLGFLGQVRQLVRGLVQRPAPRACSGRPVGLLSAVGPLVDALGRHLLAATWRPCTGLRSVPRRYFRRAPKGFIGDMLAPGA